MSNRDLRPCGLTALDIESFREAFKHAAILWDLDSLLEDSNTVPTASCLAQGAICKEVGTVQLFWFQVPSYWIRSVLESVE